MARVLLALEAMRFLSVLFVSIATAALLSGCHSQNIDDRASEKLAEVRATAERNAVYPTCRDRSTITANCGLIVKHTSTEDFRTKFYAKKCVGKTDAECETDYRRMIDVSLEQRYGLADWRAVRFACDSDPGRCDDAVAYELLLLDSHNLHVRDEFARAENETEAERDEAQRRHAAAQLDVVFAVSAAADIYNRSR